MALSSAVCDFGWKAPQFNLPSTEGIDVNLKNASGNNGTLIMFICNHCPYVKAIIKNIVDDTNNLRNLGVNAIAIMSNDTKNYPDDSFDKMKDFAKDNKFNFPYVIDETQEIAKKFGAVCTPDFFGYNSNNELQYRGRMRELKELKPVSDDESDLFKAMKLIAQTGKGPKNQIPSMGCNIKWFN